MKPVLMSVGETGAAALTASGLGSLVAQGGAYAAGRDVS